MFVNEGTKPEKMEDDQQFCLRWNNHQSTLIQNFDTLLESGTLVDCTLAAEGKYLKAHKVVLSACSPYFEGLLSEHYDKHPVFILKDVKFKELKAMMDYMYRGEVNISQDQLAALLKAAESLQIKGLSESKTSGSSKTDSRQQKVVPQTTSQPDIPISSSGLTIEKNKVPRQGISQGSVGDLPEDSASPQIPKGLSSREGSQSPTSRKRKRFRRKSIGDDNSVENHEASNSSDMPQQMGVPALGITPVADEKTHADPTDSIGRSALMTQLTKPADEMLQLPLEKPEPNDNLIEPKSEYLEDPEESVEDLTLDDDMNDLNEMEQDNNRAGPSHDPSQHPGIGAWHVTGDRSNAGGVVGSVAGAPGTTDEVFLAAQEAAQAHRDSQGISRRQIVLNYLMQHKKAYTRGSVRNNRKGNDSSSEEENSPEISSRNRQTRNAKQSSSYERNNYSKCNENYSKGKKNYLKCEENIYEKDETTVSLNRRSSFKRNRNQQERGDNDHNSLDRNNAKRRGNTHREAFSQDNNSQDNNSKFSETSTSAEWMEAFDSNLFANQICCPYCKMTFSRRIHLSKHLKNNCLKNPVAKCNSDLINNPYVCKTCGLRFKMQKFLNYHARHVCGRTVVCDICHTELKGSTVSGKHKKICMQKQKKRSLRNKTENENQSTFSNLSSNLSDKIECCDSD
ncbi:zinc finger and BTB domain-containing protein 5-like isoform X2 [Frieseomelitta varia]|uniref:zinc finger and BTB domain-containing protein 5-like isoform X2 n=1 Tax=Frieseomelitta varia TaxID=561572 RepID=UPI001CB6AD45|nr:zinc finger and BTB domain-containing protein 5-like isoform X2 [Frieseomelitta varia]